MQRWARAAHHYCSVQINSALHPSGVAKSNISFRCCKNGNVTSAGRQVTLCDPIWHVSSHSGVAGLHCELRILYITERRPTDRLWLGGDLADNELIPFDALNDEIELVERPAGQTGLQNGELDRDWTGITTPRHYDDLLHRTRQRLHRRRYLTTSRTQAEMTSQNLRSLYDRHFVAITWHDVRN